MEVKELVNTLQHSLTEVEDGDTLLDVEAEALADTLADRVAEVKAGKVGETRKAEMEAETIGKILSDVEA